MSETVEADNPFNHVTLSIIAYLAGIVLVVVSKVAKSPIVSTVDPITFLSPEKKVNKSFQ